MSSIYVNVRISGARASSIVRSLVDTGAEVSLFPVNLAKRIGAWTTNRQITVVGVHGQSRTLLLIACRILFPSLGNLGGQVICAMIDENREPIIGMDVLRPMGVSINTKTGALSVRNEVWEAFKTLAGVGVAFYASISLLEAMSGSKKRRHRRPIRASKRRAH